MDHRVAIAEYIAESNLAAPVERDQLPSDHRPVVWEAIHNAGQPEPPELASNWQMPDLGLFNWQSDAIGDAIASALIPDQVKADLVDRAVVDLGNRDEVASATHRDALDDGIRKVLYGLNPSSAPADIQPAIDAACVSSGAFPFC